MRKLLSFVVLCVFSSAMSLAQVSNDNEDGVYKVNKYASRWKEGEVIIKFKDDSGVQTTTSVKGRRTISTKRKVSTVLNNLGLEEMEQLMPLTGNKVSSVKRRIKSGRMVQDTDLSKLVVAKFDKSKASVNEAIEQLKALDEVEFAEPNYVVTICSADDGNTNYDDPLLSDQWGLDAINIQSLWAMPKKETRRPVIAILDTGVDITHPDLAENIWTNSLEADGEEFADDDNNGFYDDVHGWDFVNNTAIIKNGMDGNGHGTHCAGIAAAVGNNGIGVVGANPDAYILPIKVMGDNGSGTVSTIIQGIDYAVACGADVLSMSIGSAYSMAEEEALLKAYAKYVVCVGAAGNSSTDINVEFPLTPTPSFPAAFDFVVGVQATQESGALANFSNYDPDGPFFSSYPSRHNNNADFWNYEVKAPGANIMSTYPGGKYKKLNGTSMACPMVAGAISRILQVRGYDYAKDYGIYGDIAESKNNEGVFDAQKVTTWTEDNRNVALRLLSVRVDDSEFGDGDGELDAGEIVDLYPTVRSLWGNAVNTKAKCFIKNENINEHTCEFIIDNVDLGLELNSQGMGECANPIRVKIGDNVNDGYNLKLFFNLTCDNMSEEEMNNEQEVDYRLVNGVELKGLISDDLTLYPDKHYVVTQNVAIKAGVTFTILPGTVLKFKDNTALSVQTSYKNINDAVYDSDGNYIGWREATLLDTEKSARLIIKGEPGNMIVFTKAEGSKGNFKLNFGSDLVKERFIPEGVDWGDVPFDSFSNDLDQNYLEYVKITGCTTGIILAHTLLKNCVICDNDADDVIYNCALYKTNEYNNSAYHSGTSRGNSAIYTNSCNNLYKNSERDYMWGYNGTAYCNIFPSYSFERKFDPIILRCDDELPVEHTTTTPSYYGSSKESIVRNYVMDFFSNHGFGYYNLDNMLKEPNSEAHGIVWKIVVDGYDCQDDFEIMPPLGVGKHEVKVYFNRPMDTTTTPNVSMGLLYPYTQTSINEDCTWSDDKQVFTTHLVITGKSNINGLNQLSVSGAKDNEFFDVPIENKRFKVLVQSAGSMSTGLVAETGVGKVKLTWETEEESFADLMGYNVYRFEDPKDDSNESYELIFDEEGNFHEEKGHWTEDGEWVKFVAQDTIMVNTSIIEPNETEFTDYDVVPGTTYYYLIKEIGTDLVQHDVSNVVTATPLTASKGDANGSMSVDIADVVTEVAYLTDQNPQPFIFDAADVNEDETINILDVVGTVNIIASPSVTNQSIDNTVTYTIEDGILYVESTTPLGGIQVSVKANINEHTWFTALEGLDGMEHAGTWLNDNEYMLLAYSMSGKTIPTGKQPILQIGDKDVKNIIVSDPRGHNLVAINGTATSIEELPYGIDECKNAEVRYFDITGRAVSASAAKTKGVYIVSMYVNGKCVKSYKLLNK